MAHLATRAVVAAKFLPTYAQAHNIDDEEAQERLFRALGGRLLDDVLDAAWQEMTTKAKRLDEAALLEKVATTLRDRPTRPGRVAKSSPTLSAFLLLADIEAGTASDATRRALETPEGQRRAREGLAEAGRHLAAELTRGP